MFTYNRIEVRVIIRNRDRNGDNNNEIDNDFSHSSVLGLLAAFFFFPYAQFLSRKDFSTGHIRIDILERFIVNHIGKTHFLSSLSSKCYA